MSSDADKNFSSNSTILPIVSRDGIWVFLQLLMKSKQSFKRTKSSFESEQRFLEMKASIPCIRLSRFNLLYIYSIDFNRDDIAPCSIATSRLKLICAVPVFTPFLSVLKLYSTITIYDKILNKQFNTSGHIALSLFTY